MTPLRILHFSDGRPGHYHLAEGVITALGRLRETQTQTVGITRRRMAPGRILRRLAVARWYPPRRLLKLGYALAAENLEPAGLVLSSGGDTLPANIAASRLLGAPNIFIGSRRRVAPERFSLIVSSYAHHAGLPRHLVTLKPSALDPDTLGRPQRVPRYGPGNPPELAGLLIGGNSGLFKYKREEWRRVFEFARVVSQAWGTRWMLSTSRRTDPDIAQAAFDLAKDKAVVADFVDYRLAGPGTLKRIFGRSDVIVCSEDSSTMISEGVWARLPVVGFSPGRHSFKPEEAEYRQQMLADNRARFLPISGLTVEAFGEALAGIEPLDENPLDRLAAELRARLPELFAG